MNLIFNVALSFPQSCNQTRGPQTILMIFSLVFSLQSATLAQWPQILGPERNAEVKLSAPLSDTWPSEAPIAWRADIGNGFSGVAISDNKVLAFHRQGREEILEALELETGKSIWKCSWSASYQGSFNPDDGPRTVPAIAEGRAFCYGAAGDLACVQLSDGKLLWRRALREEYEAEDGYFGAGASPLLIDDLAIICVGGEKGGVVAVEASTGKTRWTSTEFEASYASPVAIKQAAQTYILAVMRLNTVLLRKSDGALLSSVRFGSRGPTVNAATPARLPGDRFFLTASYNIGSLILGVKQGELVEEQRGDLLYSQYNTPVVAGDDYLVGVNGREDVGVASLRAINFETQKILWEKTGVGATHLLSTGSRWIGLSIDGSLRLISPSAEAFNPLAELSLPAGLYRALPAMSEKMLFVRRNLNSGDSEILRIDLP